MSNLKCFGEMHKTYSVLKQDIIQIKEIELPAHKSMCEPPGMASKQIMPRIMMIDFQWAENVYALNAYKNSSMCQNLKGA